MAVPDYQSLMLPLLRSAGGKEDKTSSGEAISRYDDFERWTLRKTYAP